MSQTSRTISRVVAVSYKKVSKFIKHTMSARDPPSLKRTLLLVLQKKVYTSATS